MSQENVEIVRELFAAISQRDLARLLELTDPDVEWRSFFAAFTSGGEYHGHDGIRQYVADLDDAWEIIRPEMHDFLDAGQVVVGLGRVLYRGKGSGVETVSPAGWMLKVRDGRVVRFRAFRDPEQALEAVGLSE